MSEPWHPGPTPPYQPYSPSTPHVFEPRNRTAAIALILLVLALLAAALYIVFRVASHAYTEGCIVDTGLKDAAVLCAVVGLLLSVGAALTGLLSVISPHRARGAFLAMGIVALVIGVIGVLVCFGMFDFAYFSHDHDPRFSHPC